MIKFLPIGDDEELLKLQMQKAHESSGTRRT